ncbi:UNVERIFIED_CONTAM: hypothetical protein P3C90_10875 [Pseudomonas aeruginosa]|uniref:hypothetical protein n=1 Tax=Pseudomonas TaxID=286 RepID=UPI0021587084|nr:MULTISPECIES: hypothetical protein [unclassified Pseudomonas]HBP1659202.1 hypothetical protein [Pseudomonas aeruginosa]HEP8319014.1 hypothetical protein [Pseudomonas aeruginosa]
MPVCNLCLKETELSLSHIIPRSFLKRLKKSSPQLIKIQDAPGVRPVKENADWKERLLCGGCEVFINENYERGQILFLRGRGNVSKSHDKITFRNFDFERFYLFLLSILWRASISSHEAFEVVKLTQELQNVFRQALLNREDKISGSVRVSDVLKIGIVRITNHPYMTEEETKSIISHFNLRHTEEGHIYYFMVEGFLISYCLPKSSESEFPRDLGVFKNSFFLRMPKVQVEKSEVLAKMYEGMISKAIEFSTELR